MEKSHTDINKSLQQFSACKYNVIVIGTSHPNTLGMIRSLGDSILHLSIILVLCGEVESFLTQSKYVSRTIFLKNYEDLTDVLLEIATDEKQVIISVSDKVSHQLDINAEKLCPHFFFFHTAQHGDLTRFMNKDEQDVIAEQVGLSVPTNYTPDSITYPCLLKPLASIAGGKRVIICYNNEQVNQAIKEFPDTQFQIQEYLKKEQEIVLVGMSANGEVHIPAFVLKHREIWGGTTYSTVYPISDVDELLLSQSKQLIKNIGYEGLFGIEYILCKGKYFFIEVNLRTDATCYAVTVAGVNLPLAYVLAVRGEPINMIIHKPIQTIDAMVEFNDFEFVQNKELSFFKWIRQRNHCKCLYYKSKTDKMPYIYLLRRRLSNKILKILKLKK